MHARLAETAEVLDLRPGRPPAVRARHAGGHFAGTCRSVAMTATATVLYPSLCKSAGHATLSMTRASRRRSRGRVADHASSVTAGPLAPCVSRGGRPDRAAEPRCCDRAKGEDSKGPPRSEQQALHLLVGRV